MLQDPEPFVRGFGAADAFQVKENQIERAVLDRLEIRDVRPLLDRVPVALEKLLVEELLVGGTVMRCERGSFGSRATG